jgi:hypothetical protein
LSLFNSDNFINLLVTYILFARALNSSNTKRNLLGDVLFDDSDIDMTGGLNHAVVHTLEAKTWVLLVDLA